MKTTDSLNVLANEILDEWWAKIDKTEWGYQVKEEIKKILPTPKPKVTKHG